MCRCVWAFAEIRSVLQKFGSSIAFNWLPPSSILRHETASAMFEDLGEEQPAGSDVKDNKGNKGNKRAAEGEAKRCALPMCEEPIKKGSRWCYGHNRYAEVILYQAGVREEKEKIPDFKKQILTKMKDTNFANDEIMKMEEESPPGKWARKPLVNFAQFEQRFGKRDSNVHKKRGTPYEKKQFTIRRMTKFGRSDAEAEHEWNEYHDDVRIERDNGGFKGQLRLWLEDKEFKDRINEQFMERTGVERSDVRMPGGNYYVAIS